MPPTQADLQETSETVGSFLSIETQHGETVELTSDELADRLSLPMEEIDRVMGELARDDYVPVEKDGDRWVVEG